MADYDYAQFKRGAVMLGNFGMTELLVVLAIVLLVFGPKRLKSIGSELGSAIKGFRKSVVDAENKEKLSAECEVNEVAADKANVRQNTSWD